MRDELIHIICNICIHETCGPSIYKMDFIQAQILAGQKNPACSFFSSNWVQSSGGFRSINLVCSKLQSFQTFLILAIFIAQKKRLARNTEKIMSHESLARMVEYSHKMIEKIAKEVENNFIARKELFQFSKFQVEVPLDPYNMDQIYWSK